MSGWLMEMFGVEKPIIVMCHLLALPGDPQYDPDSGMRGVVEAARQDVASLQEGGVDGIMFSNEASWPYTMEVEAVTVAAMARVIGELKSELSVQYGADVLWDPIASLDLAVSVGACFVREVFTGIYASDFRLWTIDCGRAIRHQHAIGAQDIKLLFNIVPESAAYISPRQASGLARSTVFNAQPDALCVSGLTAGEATSAHTLNQVKEAVPATPIFANTGVHKGNVQQQLAVADGAIVGTTFKHDANIWNPVDPRRDSVFMEVVKGFRGL